MSVDFSSWPREQEATFQVYEQRNAESSAKAWTFAGIIAGVFFVFGVGVYKGVEPDIKDLSKDMNMSNLTKKSAKSAAPKTEAPKPEAPKPAPVVEAPKQEPPKVEPIRTEPPKTQQPANIATGSLASAPAPAPAPAPPPVVQAPVRAPVQEAPAPDKK